MQNVRELSRIGNAENDGKTAAGCWYKNYDGEGKLSGHRSWAKMILESSCGTGCAACHDKYNLHNTLMRKDYDIGFVSLFAK